MIVIPFVANRDAAVIAPELIDIPLMVLALSALIRPEAMLTPLRVLAVFALIAPLDEIVRDDPISIPPVVRVKDLAVTAPALILTPLRVSAEAPEGSKD